MLRREGISTPFLRWAAFRATDQRAGAVFSPVAGTTAAWMPPSSPHGWVDGVSRERRGHRARPSRLCAHRVIASDDATTDVSIFSNSPLTAMRSFAKRPSYRRLYACGDRDAFTGLHR
ncbi:hypothetical protein IB62_004670 [Xanthomonas euvesicatoria]|nr:hypothetical protein IB62_004670 [Xanthomonas euvesicatoria]